MYIIRTLAWLVCSVYCTIPAFWIVIHPFSQRWRRQGRNAYSFLLPIWAIFIASAAAATYPFLHRTLYHTHLALMPGLIFILLGVFIYSRAFPGFGREKVSGLAELEPDRHQQSLVVSGIRSRVRHPIYLGHLLEVIGWSVLSGSLAVYCLGAFGVLTGAVMLRLEDRELESRFGDPYREYRRRVPAIFPRLGM